MSSSLGLYIENNLIKYAKVSKNNDLIKLIRFSIVGVGNTLVNWGIFFILNAFGVYYIISNIIAYTIATINSYIWNSLWVFKYGQGLNINTSVKFFILNLVGLTANTTIMYILVDILNLNKFMALVLASVVVVIMNYTINKLWVFKEENNAI